VYVHSLWIASRVAPENLPAALFDLYVGATGGELTPPPVHHSPHLIGIFRQRLPVQEEVTEWQSSSAGERTFCTALYGLPGSVPESGTVVGAAGPEASTNSFLLQRLAAVTEPQPALAGGYFEEPTIPWLKLRLDREALSSLKGLVIRSARFRGADGGLHETYDEPGGFFQSEAHSQAEIVGVTVTVTNREGEITANLFTDGQIYLHDVSFGDVERVMGYLGPALWETP
jgi:hypothetical protein